MHIASRLHVAQYVILQVGHRFQNVGYVLILLNISNHVGGFSSFGKIDEICTFDYRGYTVFDECQVGEINAWDVRLARSLILHSQLTKERDTRRIREM